MKLPFLATARGIAGGLAIGILVLSVPAAAETGQPSATARASEPALSPAGEALRAALSRDPALSDAYAAIGFEPVWTGAEGELTPRGHALVEALADAPRHALPARRYAAGIDAARSGMAAEAREIEMSRAFLAYARDVSSGLLTPRAVDRDIAVNPVRPDPETLLAGVASAEDAAAFLAALAPQSSDYRTLLGHLDEMRRLAADPDAWGPTVGDGPILREGDRDRRVRQIRERLARLGDLDGPGATAEMRAGADVILAANDVASDAPVTAMAAASEPDPALFDAALAEAVRRFQERHGLNRDGAVGPATLAQLNASPAFRANQIAVNLERIRWLNRDLGRRHVKVNIADFTMRVMEDGERVFDSRVVVGTRRHQTPEFSDVMDHMVVNPTWFVPRSIAVNEILPKLQEDPTYLDRKGYRLSGADPYMVDWASVTPATFPGSIRQRPGEDNALGRVKFMFPNDFSIYLHDTPQRHLFPRDVRAYSHGCVRVEKPLEFAHFLLSDQEADPAGTFARWLDAGRERYVQLDEHIPVHITYRTAWVDETGADQFRGDIYGRDAAVIDALRAAGVGLVEG